jgi:sarcosine oxidase subunit gamma
LEPLPLATFPPHTPSPAFALTANEKTTVGILACELPHVGCVWLRGHSDDVGFRQRMRGVLGVPLPLKSRSLGGFGGGTGGSGVALRMSADEWLLVCRHSQRDRLLHAMRDALLDVFAQVLDTGGGMAAVRLAGPHCLALLQQQGPGDITLLAPGSGASMVMAEVTVIVLRTHVDGALLVFRRGFAGDVRRQIERAAQAYGLIIAEPAPCADPLLTPLFEAA